MQPVTPLLRVLWSLMTGEELGILILGHSIGLECALVFLFLRLFSFHLYFMSLHLLVVRVQSVECLSVSLHHLTSVPSGWVHLCGLICLRLECAFINFRVFLEDLQVSHKLVFGFTLLIQSIIELLLVLVVPSLVVYHLTWLLVCLWLESAFL